MTENQKNKDSNDKPLSEIKPIVKCPFCHGTKIVKTGQREKKLETVQVWFCQHCNKKFTPLLTKNKTYPVALILRCLIDFNRFASWGEIVEGIKKDHGITITIQSVTNWVKEYKAYQPFLRMRNFLATQINQKKAKLSDFVFESRLFHGQIYDFKFHRAKLNLLLEEDFRNNKHSIIRNFLNLVIADCPHQLFQQSDKRASEYKKIFDLDEVRIVRKSNRACQMARFVLQAVANNKERHQKLQEFMLFCDSVTVATEVPILMDKEDLDHYKTMLGFKVPIELEEGKVITGHIDFIQVRNGTVHILDYKPSASKERPIEQLTIYALALSRLTSLRLYNFKCAWFDEEDYFEFYPLHVVYKKQKKGKKKLTLLKVEES